MADARNTVHELVSEIDYPMYIVTAAAGGELAGCLVGFTTQCSIDPPRFLACLSDKNRTFRVAQRAGMLVVHLVPDTEEGQVRPLRVDARTRRSPGAGGVPQLVRRARARALARRGPLGLPGRAGRGGQRSPPGGLQLPPSAPV